MRIRTVKPEFFTHPEILQLSLPSRLLLLSLFGQADDEGRLYDQPAKIRGLAFGEDDRVSMAKLLDELASAGRIYRYEVAGRRCIEVAHFLEHQRIDRPRPSLIPPRSLDEASTKPRRAVDEASLPEWNREQGTGNREGKGTGIAPTAQNGRARDPIWDVLVDAYGTPSDTGHGAMNTAAKTLRNYPADPDDIRSMISALAGTDRDWAVVTPTALAKHWGEREALVAQVRSHSPGSRALAQAAELERRGL